MPGIFDGFSFSIFDDAIFDTVDDQPPVLEIRQRVVNGVPPTKYTNQVIDI